DIAVIDLVPELTFSRLAQFRREAPECRFVLWTRAISTELAYQVMELGVRGILKKTLPPELVVKCLMKVAEGELWFDKSLTASFLTARTVTLTNRESQLVMLLAQGLKNKEIAHVLNISEGTVKVYLSRLFQKVGVKDRFELALYGLRNLQNLQALGAAPAEFMPAAERERSRSVRYQPLRTLVLERPVPAMRKPALPEQEPGSRFAYGNQKACPGLARL
ncbi:MAG: response regulator transcription factor, partial [Bryobacteraceae bacterium]